MARSLRLSRDTLATICHNNAEAIRLFERLFAIVEAEMTPVTASQIAARPPDAGARGLVTDSTVNLATGLGAVVVGGGANIVPVYADGADWRIG